MTEKPSKKTWKSPQTHLTQALEDWANITQTVKAEGTLAPDQKMLKEIEGLLKELKFKLEEFSAPVEEQKIILEVQETSKEPLVPHINELHN